MVLDPIPRSLPVHFFGSRPQPPTSRMTWWSVLQYVAACCSAMQSASSSFESCVSSSTGLYDVSQCAAVRCSALQCVAVCRSVSQCVAVCCSAHHQDSGVVSRLPLACMLRCNALQCVVVSCSEFHQHVCIVSRLPLAYMMWCSVFRCVAVYWSALQCTSSRFWSFVSSPTGLYDVLQCVAVCCSVLQCVAVSINKILQLCLVSHSPGVVQCIASVAKRVCWSMLERVAARCSVLQRVAACCSVLQRVAVCCSVLQSRPVRVP